MQQITFITGSTRKFDEMAAVINSDNVQLSQYVIDLPEIQELDPHAIIKAKLEEATKRLDPNARIMVEDTSLYMDALGGLPGPLVKWFLATLGPDGLAHIALKLENTKVKARTIIGYSQHGNPPQYFEGEVEGSIVSPRVKDGFGYDLIFVPNGQTKTFAEMDIDEKKQYSMRANAGRKLKVFLEKK